MAISAAVAALVYAPWTAYVAIHDVVLGLELSSSFNLPWVLGRLDRAPVAAEKMSQRGISWLPAPPWRNRDRLLLVFGPRRLGVLAGGFGVLSFAGLTWIYVLTPDDVNDFLSSNGDRVTVSLVVGLTALAPLLFEEAASSWALATSRSTPHPWLRQRPQ